MATGTWLAAAALALVAAASLATALNLDSSYEAQDEDQIQALQEMETYLRHLKDELDQRRETAESYETNMAEFEDPDIDHMTMKRFNPSGFNAVRGKRTGPLDYGDYEVPSRHNEVMKDRLLDMVNYFQYLHSRRNGGSPLAAEKRQFSKGFHAVRGKRSTLKERRLQRPTLRFNM